MSSFNTIAAVSLYFIVVFLISWLFSRRIKHDAFFVHGRDTKAWLLVLTALSTAIGGGTVFTLVQLGYVQGLSAIVVCAAIGGGLVLASFLGGRIRDAGKKDNLFTLPEFLERKFGVKAKNVAVLANLLSYLFLCALQLLALAAVGTVLLGINLQLALVLSWLVVIGYTLIGGLRSDIITDAIQAVFILPIIFILAYYAVDYGGGLLSLKTIELAALAEPQAISPALLVILALFSWMPSIIGSMDLWQRIYAADSQKTAQRFLFCSGLFLFITLLAFCFIGIIFRSSGLLSGVSPEQIPAAILSIIPPVWLPILFIGFLAALMSTGDSMLIVLSATWTHDIYKPWKKVTDENKLLKMGRISIVLFGVGAAGLALLFRDFVQLLGTALSSLAILTPAIIGGLYSDKPKQKAAYWSILTGFGIIVLAAIISLALKQTELATLAQILAFVASLLVYLIMRK